MVMIRQVPRVARGLPVPRPHAVLRQGGGPRSYGGSIGRHVPRAQEKPGSYPEKAGGHEGWLPRQASLCIEPCRIVVPSAPV